MNLHDYLKAKKYVPLKCKVWIRWDNFELDSHSVLWSVRPSEALSWGQQKTSWWYPSPGCKDGFKPFIESLQPCKFHLLFSRFSILSNIEVILRNSNTKARAMWPKDGATQSSDWFQ